MWPILYRFALTPGEWPLCDEYNLDDWTKLLQINRPYWNPRLLKIAMDLMSAKFPEVTIIWYLDDISMLAETELLVDSAACALTYLLRKLGVTSTPTTDWSKYLQEEGSTYSTGATSSSPTS